MDKGEVKSPGADAATDDPGTGKTAKKAQSILEPPRATTTTVQKRTAGKAQSILEPPAPEGATATAKKAHPFLEPPRATTATVQKRTAKKVQSITKPPGPPGDTTAKPPKDYETKPRAPTLREQYDALPEERHTYKGKVRGWEEVRTAIPQFYRTLAEIRTLSNPKVCFLNEKGQLVLVDGCAEPHDETLKATYQESRSKATRISYIDSEDKVNIIEGDDTEIPPEARVISERGLITLEEYQQINKGQFDRKKRTWIESGKYVWFACLAHWDEKENRVKYDKQHDHLEASDLNGSRRVLRINLNF